MDQEPLVKEDIDAGAELVRAFDRYAPVRTFFWAKESDNPFRYLYIAAEGVTADNRPEGYGEVRRLARELGPPVDPFRVKLIDADSPMARDAVDIQTRFPDQLPARLGGERLGDTFIDGGYLYAPLAPAAV